MSPPNTYYRRDLALVHHRGFGFHADSCAPGILRLLEPVRERKGLVLEVGCGTGLLTKHLVDAGHRVVATDASPAMLEIASRYVTGAQEVRRLTLPDDEVPAADAVVSVGHVLSYLDTEADIERALIALPRALRRPEGVLALDICDLEWGSARVDAPNFGAVEEDWAIVTKFSMPSPRQFVRDITAFVRNEDGTWDRDDEHHENVLIDVSKVPQLLDSCGVQAQVRSSFGDERLPIGLKAIVGTRKA
ncbi:MAG: class I SAM-dependent methyltransferase [Actinomycetota bacterium]|nr:class I SAM-dependent methyltransferase [Actinomycetota bacterium]